MVAPASRGTARGADPSSPPMSPVDSFASADSSACTTGSPPSRENPRDSSVPSAPTITAPTEKAVADGGHSQASAIASRIHRSSSSGPLIPSGYDPANPALSRQAPVIFGADLGAEGGGDPVQCREPPCGERALHRDTQDRGRERFAGVGFLPRGHAGVIVVQAAE